MVKPLTRCQGLSHAYPESQPKPKGAFMMPSKPSKPGKMEGIFSDFHSPNGGVRFTIDTPRNIKKYPNTKLNMEPKNDATPRVNGFRLRKPQQLGGLDP